MPTPIPYRERGFSRANKPDSTEPKMPTRITDLGSDDLGDLMANYGAWREYSERLFFEANRDYLRRLEAYEFERTKKLVTTSGKTVTDKKAVVDADEDLRELYFELLEVQNFRDFISDRINSYTNAITILSREISRRGGNRFD